MKMSHATMKIITLALALLFVAVALWNILLFLLHSNNSIHTSTYDLFYIAKSSISIHFGCRPPSTARDRGEDLFHYVIKCLLCLLHNIVILHAAL